MQRPRFEVAERNVLREWGQQKLNEIVKKIDGQEVNIRSDDFLFRTAVKQYGEVKQDADVRQMFDASNIRMFDVSNAFIRKLMDLVTQKMELQYPVIISLTDLQDEVLKDFPILQPNSSRQFKYEYGHGTAKYSVDLRQEELEKLKIDKGETHKNVSSIFCDTKNGMLNHPVVELMKFCTGSSYEQEKVFGECIATLRGIAIGNKLAGHNVPVVLIETNLLTFRVFMYDSRQPHSGVTISKQYMLLSNKYKQYTQGEDFELFAQIMISLKRFICEYATTAAKIVSGITFEDSNKIATLQQENAKLREEIVKLQRTNSDMTTLITRLNERLDQSEKRNKEIESKMKQAVELLTGSIDNTPKTNTVIPPFTMLPEPGPPRPPGITSPLAMLSHTLRVNSPNQRSENSTSTPSVDTQQLDLRKSSPSDETPPQTDLSDQTKPKGKRGRKRKSETIITDLNEIEPEPEPRKKRARASMSSEDKFTAQYFINNLITVTTGPVFVEKLFYQFSDIRKHIVDLKSASAVREKVIELVDAYQSIDENEKPALSKIRSIIDQFVTDETIEEEEDQEEVDVNDTDFKSTPSKYKRKNKVRRIDSIREILMKAGTSMSERELNIEMKKIYPESTNLLQSLHSKNKEGVLYHKEFHEEIVNGTKMWSYIGNE